MGSGAIGLRALLFGISGENDLDVLLTKEVRIMSRRKHVKVSLDGEVARLKTPLDIVYAQARCV